MYLVPVAIVMIWQYQYVCYIYLKNSIMGTLVIIKGELGFTIDWCCVSLEKIFPIPMQDVCMGNKDKKFYYEVQVLWKLLPYCDNFPDSMES